MEIKLLKPREVAKETGLSYEWALAFCKRYGIQISRNRYMVSEEVLLAHLKNHRTEALV